MFKKSINIAMAFVGVVVGAGFASGQEALQFFVAFGPWGIVAAVFAGIMLGIAGMIVLKFGSYFLADEHNAVFSKVTYPVLARVIDYGIMATLFAVGFVMFAGAGANLQQQFGLPMWMGAVIMLVLVVATGFLDVDRVSQVIGAATPFIIFFLVLAMYFAIRQAPADLSTLQPYTEQVATELPNWWVSSINYIGFSIIVAASMCIVIGGAHHDTRAAGWGGLLGGAIYGLLLTGLVVSLWVALPVVGNQAMPTLALVDSVNPVLGDIMAIVIFAMIYNTAIGMFYAMSRRLTVAKPTRFRAVYVAMCLVGFVLSFVGFKTLVSYLYPLLGYVGVVLIVVLIVAYLRGRSRINAEIERRETIRGLLMRKLNPKVAFTKIHARKLKAVVAASPAEDATLEESITSDVTQELIDDGHLELADIEPVDEAPKNLVTR
ncbi:YkvI family membrane protein [Corynebacterium sp. H130]|uniref:YkvI family membrane protein n=1 Tax=Corynebacterium sp. H130 TaxID=3133444 RepID=UPI0030A71B06